MVRFPARTFQILHVVILIERWLVTDGRIDHTLTPEYSVYRDIICVVHASRGKKTRLVKRRFLEFTIKLHAQADYAPRDAGSHRQVK